MARGQGIKTNNNFIRGLVTETTALKFPTDACTETWNCIFDQTGRITRRPGFDLETDYVENAISTDTNEVYTEYTWTSVGGFGDACFLVQQQGSTLHFFDISTDTTVSLNKKSFTVDLSTFAVSGGNKDPALFPVSYAQGNGDLIVVGAAIEPFYIKYDYVSNDITATAIVLQVRDFQGMDDALDLNERVTESVSSLKTNNPEHYYNLLNQGWHATDALSQWDTARTDMPSNADTVLLYRSSATDAFDNTLVTSKGPGNTPAPKGHFLLTTWDPDRNTAMTAEGFTGATVSTGIKAIGQDVGTPFTFDSYTYSGGTGGLYVTSSTYDKVFDTLQGNANGTWGVFPSDVPGTVAKYGYMCASGTNTAAGWDGAGGLSVGKHFASPFRIVECILYGQGTSDSGGPLSGRGGFFPTANGAGTVTINLYGKQGSAPTTATDGTLLGTLSFTNTNSELAGRTVTSSDEDTFWDHAWVTMVSSTSGGGQRDIAELYFRTKENVDAVYTTIERPKATTFFAGRVWYAGIDAFNLSGNIYYSQIILNRDQYGRCYQKNDPTSETVFDLLSDDGGVIKIPEASGVKYLFAYQDSIMVFATNGVWLITGGTNIFTATDYTVKKLSSIGTVSPYSFVDAKGLPVWWAEDGIYTIVFDANYNSFKVASLTDETIKTFILDIPTTNRQYVKGVYSFNEDIAYWVYNDSDSLSEADKFKYNRVLCFDALSKAFYPWTIEDSVPEVRGIAYVVNADRSEPPVVKFTTTYDDDTLTYSQVKNLSYSDWKDYATDIGTSTDEKDYESYFITGYQIDAELMKFFQNNYIIVFMDTLEDSSLKVQNIWGYTNTSNSGKWSSPQEAYPDRDYVDVQTRRLKMRGEGRALQLRMRSSSGKPFSIIGWSLWETANAVL